MNFPANLFHGFNVNIEKSFNDVSIHQILVSPMTFSESQKQLPEVFYKNRWGALKNFAKFTGKHLCHSLFFRQVFFIKKETLAQVFSIEFCKIFKNTFFTKYLQTTAS